MLRHAPAQLTMFLIPGCTWLHGQSTSELLEQKETTRSLGQKQYLTGIAFQVALPRFRHVPVLEMSLDPIPALGSTPNLREACFPKSSIARPALLLQSQPWL